MAIEKNQNPGSPFGATSLTALPIWPNVEVNGLDWHCCLAASSKRAPRILIFSIAMDANYTFYVKSIETHVHAFLPLNISAVISVAFCLCWLSTYCAKARFTKSKHTVNRMQCKDVAILIRRTKLIFVARRPCHTIINTGI